MEVASIPLSGNKYVPAFEEQLNHATECKHRYSIRKWDWENKVITIMLIDTR